MADTRLAGRNGHSTNGDTPAATEGPSGKGADGDAGSGGGVGSLIGRALRGVAAQAQRRIPRADLDERDPDFIRERLPLMWLLASLWYRGEVRGLGNIPDDGPVLMVGNHSGGNMTPDTVRVHARLHHLLRRRAALLPAGPQPRALDARAGSAAQVRHRRRVATQRPSGAGRRGGAPRLPGRRLRGPPAELAGQPGRLRRSPGLHPPGPRRRVPIVPVVSIGGQETALFLSRGEGLARLLALDRMLPPQGAADLPRAAVDPQRRRHARPHPAPRQADDRDACRRSTWRRSSVPTPISTRSMTI